MARIKDLKEVKVEDGNAYLFCTIKNIVKVGDILNSKDLDMLEIFYSIESTSQDDRKRLERILKLFGRL